MSGKSKEDKVFQNLLKVTEQYMRGRGFVPLSINEMIERLTLPEQHHVIFKEILKTLVKQGVATLSGNKYSLKRTEDDIITGVLRVHPRGFGFLQAEDKTKFTEDIFIPKHLTMNAVDGDTVEVQVNLESISPKGPEGRVTAILGRSRTHVAGTVRTVDWKGVASVYVPLLGASHLVVAESTEEFPLRVGDRIIMEVIEWGTKEKETFCHVSHHLGHISDPSTDIPAVIEEYELRNEFPTKVLREADEFKGISPAEIKKREDLREIETFTIDPPTAKDFDDALSLKKDKKGNYHLIVHVADASHYITPGSGLDEEARTRANSVYFPGFCLPMLPPVLSENLLSIRPNTNRLAVSVHMQLDKTGSLIEYRISRSVIRSKKRFTYAQAKEIIDGKKKSIHSKTLVIMADLCRLLQKKRSERGSIAFVLPELVLHVDERGKPEKVEKILHDISHQLVEEFMLKANEVIAQHLSSEGKGLAYRIHEEPLEENLKEFAQMVGAFGFKLPDRPTAVELQKFFEEAMESSYGGFIASSYIRRMRLAIYSPENLGHYGLGLEHYCHFTSPIRRYIDLIIHRSIFDASESPEKLEQIATYCSEQERLASKAENSVELLKKLRLLEQMKIKDPSAQYEGLVTLVKNFGFYFEIPELMLQGFLHVSDLEDDYFVYQESKGILKGNRSGKVYGIGEKVLVMLSEIDFILLETKWHLVPSENSRRKKTGQHKTHRRRR